MKYDKTIGAKVDAETYQQVQLLALERVCNPSDVVRDAVKFYMKQFSTPVSYGRSHIFMSNQQERSRKHSGTGITIKKTKEHQRTASLVNRIQAKNIEIMKDAKLKGELVGGLIVALIMLSK